MAGRRTDPSSLLPLTPAVLHILLALAEGERHGYAIAQEIERVTDGQVAMGPGTLYGSIQRMMSDGLIERAPKGGARPGDDPRRRYYRSTPLGARVLELELDRLAAVVDAARRRRLLPAAGSA